MLHYERQKCNFSRLSASEAWLAKMASKSKATGENLSHSRQEAFSVQLVVAYDKSLKLSPK
jgi:hypothetical protein